MIRRLLDADVDRPGDPADVRGFRVVQTTDSVHPYTGNYWPVGHIIGYEHTFINFMKDVIEDFVMGRPAHPSFEEGLMVQKVLDAGATPFMHFPQRNPLAAIDFYRNAVMPRLR